MGGGGLLVIFFGESFGFRFTGRGLKEATEGSEPVGNDLKEEGYRG